MSRSHVIVDANGDHWEIPGEVYDPLLAGSVEVSVSYRSFGTDRAIATTDGALIDTVAGSVPEAGPDHSFPKARTNPSRKENLYLSHQSGSPSLVDVYQITP